MPIIIIIIIKRKFKALPTDSWFRKVSGLVELAGF